MYTFFIFTLLSFSLHPMDSIQENRPVEYKSPVKIDTHGQDLATLMSNRKLCSLTFHTGYKKIEKSQKSRTIVSSSSFELDKYSAYLITEEYDAQGNSSHIEKVTPIVVPHKKQKTS